MITSMTTEQLAKIVESAACAHVSEGSSSEVVRVHRMTRDERRAILLLTPQERKAALLWAAHALTQQLGELWQGA